MVKAAPQWANQTPSSLLTVRTLSGRAALTGPWATPEFLGAERSCLRIHQLPNGFLQTTRLSAFNSFLFTKKQILVKIRNQTYIYQQVLDYSNEKKSSSRSLQTSLTFLSESPTSLK